MLVFLGACAPAATRTAPDARTAQLERLHESHRVAALAERRFGHARLWSVLEPLVDAAPALHREEIGRSGEGRPIYAVRFGTGATRVLLWSQMHGDESTATMALADIVHLLATAPDDPRVRRLGERLTLVMVPMLNPDGAERFQRRNAYGVDINRDARMLSTPEARALKAVHERYRPEFGFNLHDQNVRTRVGDSDRLVAIALLAPAPNGRGEETPGHARAERVAAVVGRAVEPLVGGHVARYDDTFNPRAFGDLMQSWGTSTVLIESGGWQDDPEKQYLRRVNFVALMEALESVADGSYAQAGTAPYLSLPVNGEQVSDLVIRGGTLVIPGLEPVRVDVAADFADPLRRLGGRVTEVGDLGGVQARDTLDAAGLFLHPAAAALANGGRPSLGPGSPATFVLRRSADPQSEAVWVVEAGRLGRP